MSDLWELICHHTYSGKPGVVYDLSDGHGSHGLALGIGSAAFVADGAAPGSGAVRIREDGERVYIPPTASWSPLGGLRAELTVRLDSQTTGLALHLGGGPRWLIAGYHFNFAVVGSRLHASFNQAPDPTGPITPPSWSGPPATIKPVKVKMPSWGTDVVRTDLHGLSPNIQVPYDRWVRLGFTHDGLTKIELTIDGIPVARPNRAGPSGQDSVSALAVRDSSSSPWSGLSTRSRCGAWTRSACRGRSSIVRWTATRAAAGTNS